MQDWNLYRCTYTVWISCLVRSYITAPHLGLFSNEYEGGAALHPECPPPLQVACLIVSIIKHSFNIKLKLLNIENINS